MKAQNEQEFEQQNVFGSGTPFPSQSCSGGGVSVTRSHFGAYFLY